MTKKIGITKQEALSLLRQTIGIDRVAIAGDPHQRPDGSWRVAYHEIVNGSFRRSYDDFESEKEANEFIKAFGGKNPFTIAISPEYLVLDSLSYSGLASIGYEVERVQTGKCYITFTSDSHPEDLPTSCGQKPLIGADRQKTEESITLNSKNEYGFFVMPTTVQFNNPKQIDLFKAFLVKKWKKLNLAEAPLSSVVLRNTKTGNTIMIRRKKVGDGTKTMEMRVTNINGTPYSDLRFNDILAEVHENLHSKVCSLIKKKSTIESEICGPSRGV